MGYVKTYESFLNESSKSADEIIRYIKSLTPSDSDHPDYFISLIKKSGKSFELKTLKIDDVVKMDKDLAEYVKSGEVRYGEGGVSDLQPYDDELDNPIVIFDGYVVDGYSRTSTLYKHGVKNIQAWVSK